MQIVSIVTDNLSTFNIVLVRLDVTTANWTADGTGTGLKPNAGSE